MQFFENNLTRTIILENEHRFKNDPEVGTLLKRFWSGDLTHRNRSTIKKRVMTKTVIELLKIINSNVDWSYACPTNKACNAISAGVFWMHVNNAHVSEESDELPPDHTVAIEGNFQTTTK